MALWVHGFNWLFSKRDYRKCSYFCGSLLMYTRKIHTLSLIQLIPSLQNHLLLLLKQTICFSRDIKVLTLGMLLEQIKKQKCEEKANFK